MADLEEAKRFLGALGIDPGETLHFRTFNDRGGGSPRNYVGTLLNTWPRLVAANERGSGVFLVINDGGHCAKDIHTVRAVFADCDDVGRPWQSALTWLAPHVVVESSPGKWHAYWRAKGVPAEAFKDLQKSIAARFGTDESVSDLSRVMRMPGFVHQKNEKFITRCLFWTDFEQVAYPFDVLSGNRAPPSLMDIRDVPATATPGNRHTTLMSHAGRLHRAGKSRDEIALELHQYPCNPPLPRDEIERIATDVSRYPRPLPTATSETEERLIEVAIDDVMTATSQPATFAIEPLVPRNALTLLGGHGGSGKSLLAEVMAAHVAAGTSWAGFRVEQCRVVYISLEDPGHLVKLRLRKIIEHYKLDQGAIIRNLRIFDGSAGNPALMTEISVLGTRTLIETPTLQSVVDIASGAGLIIVDNASDAFDGDENSRRQVRTFIRRLSAVAVKGNAAIILLAHIDKSAARYGAAGNSYSGSTAWHNSARSRLAVIPGEDGYLELLHEKCNLARTADPVKLMWTGQGVITPIDPNAIARAAQTASAADAVATYDLLRIAEELQLDVTTATSGPRTAWECLEPIPQTLITFPNKRLGKRRLFSSLVQLQQQGRIFRNSFRNGQRKESTRWRISPQPGT